MTAITEQTKNSTKAARGLNSIFNNLAQVLDSASSNGKKITEIFDSLGVSMYGMDGQLLSSYELLGNLAEKWDTLDTNTKNYIASTIAGTHQLNNFLALMNNFDHAIEATNTALNSAGSAAQENSRYMEGLEAKTQAVKASFEQLSNTIVDSELVKSVLDLAKGFLELANNGVGKFLIQAGLLTGVFWGGTGLIHAMKAVPSFVNGIAASFSLLENTFTLTAPHLALIAAGLVAIINIAPSISNWIKDITGNTEYYTEKLEENNSKLQENIEKLNELYDTPYADITPEIRNEIYFLQKENEELKNNIDYWNKKKNIGTLESLTNGDYSRKSYSVTSAGEKTGITLENASKYYSNIYDTDSIDVTIDKLKELGFTIEEVNEKISGKEHYEDLISEQNKIQQEFETTGKISEETALKYIENKNAIQALIDASDNVDESEWPSWLKEVITESSKLEDVTVSLANSIYTVEGSLSDLIQGYKINDLQLEQLIQKYPELSNYITLTSEGWAIEQESVQDLTLAISEMVGDSLNKEKEFTKETIREAQLRTRARIAEKISIGEMWDEEYDNLWNYYLLLQQLYNKATSSVTETPDLSLCGTGTIVDPIQEQSEKFKEQNEILEHNIFLKQKQGATEQELISLYKDYQEKLHDQAEWFRSQGLDENSEYIRNLQEQWWNIGDTIKDLEEQILDNQRESFDKRLEISENYIEERNNLNDWGTDSEIKAWKRVLDWMDKWYSQGIIDYEYYLEKRKDAYENYLGAYKDQLEEEKSLYEMLFSSVADKAQEEINELQEKREDIENRYQEQIDALEKVNEELDEQIEKEEALDALNKARQTKVLVYKDGRFQYVQDIDQVSEAQENLDKINREQQLKEEVENLEELRDKELQSIDDQIKYWEKYKEEWSSVVDDYNKKQDELLLEQELGIKLEGENWQERLKNLEEYVAQYNSILKKLESPSSYIEEETEESSSTAEENKGSQSSNITGTIGGILGGVIGGPIGSLIGGGVGSIVNSIVSGSSKNANGTIYSQGGLSLVGENGPELRVLNYGDGIIPSDITKNLWDWGSINPSGFINSFRNNNGQNNIMEVTIQNLNLPQIHNGQEFVEYMRNNFWRKTLQFQTT